jgi:FKBP-type peptidyl-prolyl cis-trans isomerase
MRDILISSAVCVGCLMLALVSQIVAPTPAQASAPAASEVRPAAKAVAVNPAAPPAELDPNESNPRLFAMAPEASDQVAQGSAADLLGGEMEATKERMTPSGLKITDLVEGTGAEAQSGNTVSVNYRGTLTNGQEFDSSYRRNQAFTFPLGGGRVIRGWDEGVVGMKEGGKRRLVIPPDLAYGSRGAGGVIGPNETLIFEIELVKVQGN